MNWIVKGIVIWVLRLVDLSVQLEGDILTLRVYLAGQMVLQHKFDLVPGEEVRK